MERTLYVTRHGESVWNVENKVQGITDMPLTPKGIEQAHILANKIFENKVPIDEILYSPLERATVTATVIAEKTGIPMFAEPRLVEQNFGRYEGFYWPDNRDKWVEIKKTFADDYEGGESMLKLAQRIFNLLDEVKERTYRENKTFLLVTHGGVNRMIRAYFNNLTNEEFSRASIPNCELVSYMFKEN